jgi:hypothetical protein
MEELELTDPVVVPEKVTHKYRVVSLLLNMETVTTPLGDPGLLNIQLRDNNQETTSYQYVGADAVDLIKWINTANFTTTSMHKRILQKLSNDGLLPGTVTGTPDPPVTVVTARDEGN